MDKKTAIVFGAGVAGLSAAHELIRAGFHVSVYEASGEAGGVAKSVNTERVFSEYSWRGFGPWYHNTFALMKEIPARINGEQSSESKSVLDCTLSSPMRFLVVPDRCQKSEWSPIVHQSNRFSFTWMDKLKLALVFAMVICSNRRAHGQYASLNAAAYLKTRLSARAWQLFCASFGPWIGVDRERASLFHMVSFFQKNFFPGPPAPYIIGGQCQRSFSLAGGTGWTVLNGPSNAAWFEPWVAHLERLQGTQVVYYHSRLCKLETDGESNRIRGATVLMGGKEMVRVEGNMYVMAVDPFSAVKIVASSALPVRPDVTAWRERMRHLIADGEHIQISFRLGFSERIRYPIEHMTFILADSEFDITVIPEEQFFKGDHKEALGGFPSVWSGTACVASQPGPLFGRPMNRLSKDELVQELKHQIWRSQCLSDLIASANNKKGLKDFECIYFEIWRTWRFPKVGGGAVYSVEPKWVTSTNTEDYLTESATPFCNLWTAGAHCRSSFNLYAMETAAVSGRKAAFHAVQKYGRGRGRKPIEYAAPWPARLIASVDDAFWAVGWPHPIKWVARLVGLLVSFGILYIFLWSVTDRLSCAI